MKSCSVLQLILLAVLAPCNDSFNHLFGVKQNINNHNNNNRATFFRQLAKASDDKEATPHPPDGPPPATMVDNDNRGTFFASKVKNSKEDQQSQSQVEEDKPFISDEARAVAQDATEKFVNSIVKPIFEREVQAGVPVDTIKGAALVGAALAVIASKGVVITSAAGLSAAYVAISQGVAGDVLRTVGGIAWDTTEAATRLYQMATGNGKLAGMSKELAEKVVVAVESTKTKAAELKEVQSTDSDAEEQDVEAAEQSFYQSQEELTRVLQEAETAIGAADAAIAKADETLGTSEDDDDDSITDTDTNAEDVAKLAKEAAKLLAAEEAIVEKERLAEEERLRAELEEEALVEEERLAEEELLREELKEAQEEVRLEEEKSKAAKAEKEADAYDDEWEAAVELAQQGIEGKIVGLDEAITDDGTKANWDAAGKLAQELEQGVFDEFDDGEEEFDAEVLGRAAREAVEIFEKGVGLDEKAKQDQREEWATSMTTDTEDSDLDAAEEMLPEGDLNDIARAAREAVNLMSDDLEDADDEQQSFAGFEDEVSIGGPNSGAASAPMLRDWSKLTVAQLKDELKVRALKTYGKKVELVALLQQYDAGESGAVYSDNEEQATSEYDSDTDSDFMDLENIDLEELGRQARAAVEEQEGGAAVDSEDDDSSDDNISAWLNSDDDGEGLDLEELGKQARAAVDASFADEPSDEVLMQLENEEPLLFEDSSNPVASVALEDYASMTVVELKAVLRSRGLKLSGRKAELIERLQ